jgi:cytochrome c
MRVPCFHPVLFAATVAAGLLLSGCDSGVRSYSITSHGNPDRGKQIIQGYGCGACHIIPGIRSARGLVGPPLNMYSRRTIVAGELPNTPENLARWIEHPRALEPRTAMPDLGLTLDQSYDVAAYLYTLR